MPARLLDAAVDLVLLDLAQLQAEGEVVVHAHVRVERVALEHHRDVAVLRRHVVDDPVADEEAPVADLLEAGHAAQRGRLAAARGADQDEELAVLDLEVQVVDGDDVFAVPLVHVVERDGRHRTFAPVVNGRPLAAWWPLLGKGIIVRCATRLRTQP